MIIYLVGSKNDCYTESHTKNEDISVWKKKIKKPNNLKINLLDYLEYECQLKHESGMSISLIVSHKAFLMRSG